MKAHPAGDLRRRGMYAKKSENGRYTVFVTNRELWAYDREEGDSICIFAFGGWNTDDLRALQDRHGVEILEVSNGGLWISWSTAI